MKKPRTNQMYGTGMVVLNDVLGEGGEDSSGCGRGL